MSGGLSWPGKHCGAEYLIMRHNLFTSRSRPSNWAVLGVAIASVSCATGGKRAPAAQGDEHGPVPPATAHAIAGHRGDGSPSISPSVSYTVPDSRRADLHVAVFKRLFSITQSWTAERPAYFVSIGQGEPSAEVLAAFSEHRPPVLAGRTTDLWSGANYSIYQIHVIGDGVVEVTAGYVAGNQSRGEYAFTIEDHDGKWVIIEQRLLAKS